jgi:diaminopimelate decarboxylase
VSSGEPHAAAQGAAARAADAAAAPGGVSLALAHAALRRRHPSARAFWIYDLDAFGARSRRFLGALAPLRPLAAFALKANALPALLERATSLELGADAVSLGELWLARAAGFAPERTILNGNGRTPEEAAWAAREGIRAVNADAVEELDLLQRAADAAGRTLRVALRVNPGFGAGAHPHVVTGDDEAKFGVSPAEALAAWAARGRWPRLALEGLHVHVGCQLLDAEPLDQAAAFAIGLVGEAARRGAAMRWVNLGGGFGIDYDGSGREFPLEAWAGRLAERAAGLGLEWIVEPGRWMVGPVGALVAEVLAVKARDGRRFVTIAAGMNDLLRPALYGARHRVMPVSPRPGPWAPADVVGPVCESADTFATGTPLPPLEPGDLLAILDAGAYGASMASTYNGRGRLAELVAEGGRLVLAREPEGPETLAARAVRVPLEGETGAG